MHHRRLASRSHRRVTRACALLLASMYARIFTLIFPSFIDRKSSDFPVALAPKSA
jgi:hypothetical protein